MDATSKDGRGAPLAEGAGAGFWARHGKLASAIPREILNRVPSQNPIRIVISFAAIKIRKPFFTAFPVLGPRLAERHSTIMTVPLSPRARTIL
jgi:hypothetical protein